ncbi:MAG: DUF4388 domain-containing protein, partial [Acidimicrobiia bacterium]
LEEVLRLLARSYKSGCLRVDSPDIHGRVYLANGSLALATVGSDEDLRRQLVISRLVSEDALRSAEVAGKSLNEVVSPSTGSHALAEFFREEVVESLYRIRKPGRGQFVFNVDVLPRYRAESAFDVELCVSEADRRAAEWADIESVIPTIDMALRISPEAPDGEPVTLAPNTWRLIAGFEGVGTVRSLSERLGTSRFRVAKDLTALVRSGLVEPVAAPLAPPEEQQIQMPTVISVVEAPSSEPGAYSEPVPTWPERGEVSPAAALTGPAEEVKDETAPSFWGPTERPEEEPSMPPNQQQPVPAASHDQSWWKEPEDQHQRSKEADSEEEGESGDPDTFLDRVFAQLNENPEGQGTTQGSGHGFLKRRRMSSIGADE